MKKTLSLLCAIILVLSLVACGGPKPEATVSTFCEGMKAFDFEKMQSCTKEGLSEEVVSTSEDTPEEILSYLKECASAMTYTIGESTIDGDNATVNVDFKYTDVSSVVTDALTDYLQEALALAFSGADMSEEAMSDLLIACINDSIQDIEPTTADTSVTFSLSKVDSEWKITEIPDEALNILTSNFIKTYETWFEDGGDADTTSSGEPETIGDPNYTWIKVALGEEIQLATVKITVTGCEETQRLEGSFSSVDADEGTKFIVFTYKVENTTKNEMYWSSSDLPLYDGKDRQYSTYEDAFWYNDDVYVYDTLAPNMPKTCVGIYNVPEDSTDYFMVTGKAGTNEYYMFMGE